MWCLSFFVSALFSHLFSISNGASYVVLNIPLLSSHFIFTLRKNPSNPSSQNRAAPTLSLVPPPPTPPPPHTLVATAAHASNSRDQHNYIGNIHPQVTESLLQELSYTAGALEGCNLIRKDKSSYGFVDYFDHSSVAFAIVTLNGRNIFG